MKKNSSAITVILFCALIFFVLFFSAITKDADYSEFENRYLQKLPSFSISSLKNGKYTEKMENYFSDHIILRDKWVSVNALVQLITGKGENGGILFADNETLIKRNSTISSDSISQKVSYINKLSENVQIPVYFGIIPSSAEIWKDKLKSTTFVYDEKSIIDEAYKISKVHNIDFWNELNSHKSEEIYFRTDHHWTSLGAYYGANAIFGTMNISTINSSDYSRTIVTEDFLGTSHSSSGAFWISPDKIETFVSEKNVSVSKLNGKDMEPSSLYDFDKLNVKDKYTYFLGGNNALYILKSENNGPKVLVIRDSYSNVLAPFLTEKFSETHLFDMRYNQSSISKYISDNNIDIVLILFSYNEFCNDTSFVNLVK